MTEYLIKLLIYSLQDILADSDSDFDDDMEVDKQPTKKTKQSETYIQEDPDSIVDLADINSIGKITCKCTK